MGIFLGGLLKFQIFFRVLDIPDQTPHTAVSDQDLYCLLTECSMKI